MVPVSYYCLGNLATIVPQLLKEMPKDVSDAVANASCGLRHYDQRLRECMYTSQESRIRSCINGITESLEEMATNANENTDYGKKVAATHQVFARSIPQVVKRAYQNTKPEAQLEEPPQAL